MKNFTLFLLSLFVSAIGFGQDTFTANKTNATSDWNTAADFNGQTADADGIPDSDDDLVIQDAAGVFNTTPTVVSSLQANSIDNITFTGQGGGTQLDYSHLTIGNSSDDILTVNSISTISTGAVAYQYRINLNNGGIHLNTLSGASLGEDLQVHYNNGSDSKWIITNNNFSFPIGQVNFTNNGVGTFTLEINTGGTYSSQFTNFNFQNIDVLSGTTLEIDKDITSTDLTGTLTIESGATLDLNEFEIDASLSSGQVQINNGATLDIWGASSFPQSYNGGYITVGATTSEFNYASTTNVTIEDQSTGAANMVIGDLRISGGAEVTIGSDIGTGNGEIDIKNLYIDSGKVIVDANLLNLTSIQVSENGILQINDNGSFDTADLTLNSGSTLIFNKSNAASPFILSDIGTVPNLVFQSQSGSVTYANSNGTLSITESLTFGSDNVTLRLDNDITLESDANGTAYIGEMLASTSITYNGGNVIAEKFTSLPSGGYRDYSSPIQGTTIEDFENTGMYILGITGSNYLESVDTNVFFFQENYAGSEGVGNGYYAPSTTSDNVTYENVMRLYDGGFAARNDNTLSFEGQINQGDVSLDLTRSGTFGVGYNGWNLIGNPYPSDISVESFMDNNADFNGVTLANTIYILAPTTNGGYCSYIHNTGITSCIYDDTIPSFQGFWVEKLTAGTTNVTFTESDKTNSNHTNIKSNSYKPVLLDIAIDENGIKTNNIGVYYYPGAKENYSAVYDAKRFSAGLNTSNESSMIDFYDGKKDMNVSIKALPSDKNILSSTIKVKTQGGTNQKITLSKFNETSKFYNCFYLVYNNTGEHINIDAEEVNIDLLNGVFEHQFTLVAKNDANYLDITKVDATCFGKEDGLLNIKGHDLPQNYYVNIYKDGELFDSFNGEKGSYKKSVVAGEYTMKVNGISKSCTYNYVTTVESNPEIISNFDISSNIETGVSVEFMANSENATDYEWTLTNTGETFFGESFSKTFESAGKQWLKLRSIGENENCFDEINKEFYVAQGTVDISEAAFFNSIEIKATDNIVKVVGLNSGDIVKLHSLDGKIINSGSVSSDEIVLSTNGNTTVIVTVETGDNKYSKKLNL